MKAEEMRLGPLLDGHKRYVVPYFQRTYSWRRQQWNTLFEDILELYELGQASQSHFLGSMVLLAENDADGSTLIIDGQQRVVTLSLFLAAIRDAAREADPAFADRLHGCYLVDAGTLKVACTQQDQAAFATVIEHAREPEPSPIRDAYRTFRAALAEHLEQGLDLERLTQIVLSRLSFVAITLDPEDNPYRIFESLNAKGMPLTQGDLLRNYFFMRLPASEHEHWYASVWAPMQRRLGDHFDTYMRDFLQLLNDGTSVRADEVYQEWRKRLAPLGEEDVRAMLRELSEWSQQYDQILHPQREQDARLRKQLERLTAWSRTLANPFNALLLRLQADYRRSQLSADELSQVFTAVESFLVRRLFTSAPAVDENQLLIQLYIGAPHAFVEALSRPRVGWPSDDDFVQAAVKYPLYFGSHPEQRKLIFEAIEDTYEHRMPLRYEQVDLQLVTPLLPRPDWLMEVGVTESQYWSVIGTLGNFTWVPRGRAPDLGVAERKKELRKMVRYGLGLVRDFADVEPWSAAEIEKRSRRLAERGLAVWPRPQS